MDMAVAVTGADAAAVAVADTAADAAEATAIAAAFVASVDVTATVLVVVMMTVAEESNNCVGGKGTHTRHRWTYHQDQDRIVRDEFEWAELLAFLAIFWLLSDSKHPANFVHLSLSPSLPPLLEPSLPPSLLFLPYAFTLAIARRCCHRCRLRSLPCCNQPANQPAN
jgi:hypothetical protein